MATENHSRNEKPMKNKPFPLNPAQKAAAEAGLGPLLIVAGAGTGKTRTLTSRIVYLIEQGMAPDRICAITFTNKAAKEMMNRIANSGLPLQDGRGPLLATFHSFGARILRKECHALGREPNFTIFDDHDSFDLLKKIVKSSFPLTKLKEKNKKDSPAFFAERIGEMKNLDDARENSKDPPERKALVQSIFEKYENALRENNAFDFDDLIQKPVELFRRHPNILLKYQTRFDAILVDEYQDINPKQYELIKLLAEGHRNLSVVGDDEQTIYSWRYANIKTFLNFDKEWLKSKVYFLEENYRSTGNIIRAATAVAENNRFRTPKKLWTQNADGELISLFEAWGENDEAAWIGEEILKLTTRVKRSEIAILYRTNAQSRAIEQALIRREIPYQIFGDLKFYERREVKDAVAALRFASNRSDTVAKERLEKNLSKRRFAIFGEKVSELTNPKPLQIIKLFLDIFGYFDYLEENFLNAEEREENIGELTSFASDFENLADLLEKVSLLQATDDPKEADPTKPIEKINLMTIHLAKGLEFKYVFIAGVAEGLLPHIRSIDNEASLEEERRLMYVAMTRAKEKLHLSFSGMPSRFLAEIPEQYLAAKVTDVDDDEGISNRSSSRGSKDFSDAEDFEENVIEF
jgi:ATP-dependent DNA helicase UvrD/PcrA